MEPKFGNNKKWQKFIEGALVEGEWDRLAGVVGHIINKTEYRAQIQGGYLSFSTSYSVSPSGMLL
jgi:hypothetical protein